MRSFTKHDLTRKSFNSSRKFERPIDYWTLDINIILSTSNAVLKRPLGYVREESVEWD